MSDQKLENPIPVIIDGKPGEIVNKAKKDDNRVQVKPEEGKMFWITMTDYDGNKNEEGVFILTSKASERSQAMKESKEIAKKNGAGSMKEYIIGLIEANPGMSPSELAKEFDLPNPIYVSKLRNGLGMPKISRAKKTKETPKAETPKNKKEKAKKSEVDA